MGKQRVLIVGAGPTGMIVALQLTQHGIPVRIIDRLPAPVTTSRAFTIHARTLELLGTVGLAEPFLASGIEVYSMDYHFPGMEQTPRLDFRALESRFGLCLTINQADTEAILRKRLEARGVSIEWSTTLESCGVPEEDEQEGVEVKLQGAGGHESAVFDWLVGCDGIHSRVREQLALPFDGHEYQGTMRMMDVPVTGLRVGDDAIHYFIAKEHMLLVSKLPGANYRVLVSDKSEVAEVPPPEEARAAFQQIVDGHFGGEVVLGSPVWTTHFRISRRKVDSFRRGRVFLAGDAAHVNSPAGGQGMNVAMQDGFNLGWKLGLVMGGHAPVSLLDSYEVERAPVAQQMLDGTSYIHSIIMAHGQGMTERIERIRADGWNERAVSQIAGLSYTYCPDGIGEQGAVPRVGDRAPDSAALHDAPLYERVASSGYTLMVGLADEETASNALAVVDSLDALRGRLRVPVDLRLIAAPALTRALAEAGHPVVVDDGAWRTRYGARATSTVFVLRPDCHIDYVGDPRAIEPLAEHLMTRSLSR
ncbi:MAG: FAD-dependent monooxygenase [Myxococcota bacterium]